MNRYLKGALAIAAPIMLLATTAAQAQEAPAQATAAATAQGDGYLDRIMGKTFFSTFMRAKVTVNDKDEWRVQGPDGGVSYIARNPAGGYTYWVTSPIGMRFDATGTIGGRGLGICFKSYCTYWVDAADGALFNVQTHQKKDGTVKLITLQAMVEDGTAAAIESAQLWKKRDTNPVYMLAKKRTTAEELLGFPLEQIEDWIGGQSDGTSLPATTLAATSTTSTGAIAGVAAPAPARVALTPADKFGPLTYLAGHDWLITETCNGATTKTVSRAIWIGQPATGLIQNYADGTYATWRFGKQPATLVRKMNTGGSATYQVEPTAVFTTDRRIEAADGKIVGSGTCTVQYAQLQDGVYDEARAEAVRLAAEERANRPKKKGGGLFKALAKTILFPAKVALVIGEAMVANPGAFTSAYQSASANTWQPSTPSDWAARINSSPAAVGDMGGVTHVAAPRYTPQQQAQAEEFERFKMREQARLGQAQTTFAQDAYARVDAEQARRNAEQARGEAEERARSRPAAAAERPTQMASNDSGSAAMEEAERKAEADRKAEEVRKAEAARKAEELAKAEALRKEKLAVEEAARKKREEAERVANELIEWKEGIVLCEPAKAPSRNSACHGPLQTTYGTLNEQSGNIAIAYACGGDPGSTREIGQAAGYFVFGCNWGIHPSRTASDVPARLGVGYIDGRRTYHCPRKQTTVCRN